MFAELINLSFELNASYCEKDRQGVEADEICYFGCCCCHTSFPNLQGHTIGNSQDRSMMVIDGRKIFGSAFLQIDRRRQQKPCVVRRMLAMVQRTDYYQYAERHVILLWPPTNGLSSHTHLTEDIQTQMQTPPFAWRRTSPHLKEIQTNAHIECKNVIETSSKILVHRVYWEASWRYQITDAQIMINGSTTSLLLLC